MIIHHDQDEYETVITSHTCSWHKANPGKPHAGCTCSGSWGMRKRAPEDVEARRRERREKHEEAVLMEAKSILARRAAAE